MVQTLETDADEAATFVNQLKNGKVPSIFQDLPDEAVLEFRNVFNIALSLPNRDPRCRRGRGRPMPPKCSTTSKTAAIVQDIEFDPRYRPVRHHERMGRLSPTSLPVPGTTRPAVSDVFFGVSKDCAQPTAVGSCLAAAAAATTQNAAAQSKTQSPVQPTGATSQGAAATTQNAAAQSLTPSPAQPTSSTTTSQSAAATTPNAAAQSMTPSPAQPTGRTSLASTRSKWAAGPGTWVTAAAVVVFGRAVRL